MSKIAEEEKALQERLQSLADNPDWESSSDEEKTEQAILAKTKKGGSSTTLSKKLRQTKRNKSTKDNDDSHNDAPSNVLYIGHLPPQFEDEELNEFLRQFGKVLKVRVSRSKKTGRSRGYGFVQMATPAIAAIVADTMSGYIMFGQQRLVCHVLPNSKVHRKLFFHYKKKDKKNMPHLRQHKPLEKMKAITVRLVERERKKREKLLAMGIDYDFPGYEAAATSVDITKEDSANETEVKQGDMGKPSKRKNSTASMDSSASKSGQQTKEEESRRKSIDSGNDPIKKRKENSTSTVAANAKSPGQKEKEKESNRTERGVKAKKQRKDSTASAEGASEKLSSIAAKEKSKAKSGPRETEKAQDVTLAKKKRKESIASMGSAKSSSSAVMGEKKEKAELKEKTKNSTHANRKGNESIAHKAIETPPSRKRKDSVVSAASAHSEGSEKKSKLDVTGPNIPPKAKGQPHSETKKKKAKKASSTRRNSV